MSKHSITIVNMSAAENKVIAEKLYEKIGDASEYIPMFAYESGTEPIQMKFNEKQRRLFVEYPKFNLITTPSFIYLYLKRKGETFPSTCFKIKKSDVKVTLSSEVINDYINDTVDMSKCLESNLTNETLVVVDNLKLGILMKSIEKENSKGNGVNEGVKYTNLYDIIRYKMDEVQDIGYLDLLNKMCVMMWETWSSPDNINFRTRDLKKEKEESDNPPPKKEYIQKKERDMDVEPNEINTKDIEEFVKPEDVPELDNIEKTIENES